MLSRHIIAKSMCTIAVLYTITQNSDTRVEIKNNIIPYYLTHYIDLQNNSFKMHSILIQIHFR